ncbi:hypothetical protein KQ939_09320 [Planococcus sp. CP5-4]|uniref:hypothetical protein n=1 Tax=unclassified Planococcus (in: firmicutes) TaxID=2662419 RepID=UPI001C221BE7|nr:MULTISPECIES: hypothetical protein [unclassified Planococcus (in: firmicutes)]MBU9674767.1 hypothetical protein [Planococcus sp. CP5-4_YE]MBV0908863.1 hypothetical protein [Planococcus sp. CP5-4_UN]MBW6063912.1 hypothetical protein [Planococcus sp. CP5-4]
MTPSTRKEMMDRLDFLIGTWAIEVFHPELQPPPITGEASFEWLDHRYIIQRTRIDKPEFPSSMIIYDWDDAKGQYVQHYFDSHGVTRLYEMSFQDGLWKLWRTTPDFSPLDFHQRFSGTVNRAGNLIESSWEQSADDVQWEHDFGLNYEKSKE